MVTGGLTVSELEALEFRYTFSFPNGTEERFELLLDPDSLVPIEDELEDLPH